MRLLNRALGANAISAFLSGAALIIYQFKIAAIFGVEKTTIFWLTGVGLVYFSATILSEIKRKRSGYILWIIAQDAIWVLASAIIVITKPFSITNEGYFLIKLFALIVLFFTVFQSVGLAQMDNVANQKFKRLSFSRVVKADKARVWSIISNVKDYHKVAPGIDNVTILSGEAQGMQRQCSHGKKRWTETCTLWEEGQQYSFEVDTKAPDYPYPLSYLKGIWIAKELSDTETEIIMHFDFIYKYKIYNVIIHPIMRCRFKNSCEQLLDNWEQQVEEGGR
ncbi:MAG: SRPBCC family protein [Flavipsychrobacter sp.]